MNIRRVAIADRRREMTTSAFSINVYETLQIAHASFAAMGRPGSTVRDRCHYLQADPSRCRVPPSQRHRNGVGASSTRSPTGTHQQAVQCPTTTPQGGGSTGVRD